MHWIISDETPAPKLSIPCIEDLLLTQDYASAIDKIGWLKSKLVVSQDQIKQVAAVTEGQRNNHLWSLARNHRLTASNFGVALASIRRNRFSPSLFKQLLSSYNLTTKEATIWGTTNEKVAKERYCSFGDAVVKDTGILLDGSGVLGANPDGIICRPVSHNYHHQVAELGSAVEALHIRPEVLEIKCPFSARNMTISEAISSVKGFCLEYEGRSGYKLKEDHPYYDQIQGQLHILRKSACDFVVWTLKDIAIIRVMQDDSWSPNMEKLLEFYFGVIIPFIQK